MRAARLLASRAPTRPRDAVRSLNTVNLPKWLKTFGPELKPPVANKLLFDGDLKVMVVGGPNERRDYHLQEGEEFFVQLEGDLVLKTIEQGTFKDVAIGAGDAFLLPSRVPHSPQRGPASLGLVFERSHTLGEMDGMLWFSDETDLGDGRTCDMDAIAYDEYFHCVDLGAQLAPVIGRYQAWRESGAAPAREPDPPVWPDFGVSSASPRQLAPRLSGLAPGATQPLYRGDEVICEAHVGPKRLRTGGAPFDVFVWQRTGVSAATVDGEPVAVNEGDCAVLEKGSVYDWEVAPGGVLLSVANAFT